MYLSLWEPVTECYGLNVNVPYRLIMCFNTWLPTDSAIFGKLWNH